MGMAGCSRDLNCGLFGFHFFGFEAERSKNRYGLGHLQFDRIDPGHSPVFFYF